MYYDWKIRRNNLIILAKFCNCCLDYSVYTMKTQKIVNLLNNTDNKFSKFAPRKWYVINDQNITEYGERNENDSSIKR